MKKIKLKYLVKSITSGGTPTSDNSLNYTEENGINWVAIGDMSTTPYVYKTQKQITKLGQKEKRLTIYPPETILYSIYATVGKVSVLKIPATINQAILAIIPNESKITNDYLKYSLIAMEDKVLEDVSTNTQANLNAEKVKNFKIALCSIEEQEKITNYLDSKISKIDTLICSIEEEINDLIKLTNVKIRENLLSVSSGELVRLQDVCYMKKGPFGSSLKKEMFVPKKENTYKVYEQQHAIYKSIDIRYFIDENKYLSMKRFSVIPGDLIMSCSGTIGKVYVIPENAPAGIINQALLKMTPKKDVSVEYLAYLIESDYFKEIIFSYSDGAAIKNIAAVQILKELKICIPNFNEQLLIVQKLDINKIMEEKL